MNTVLSAWSTYWPDVWAFLNTVFFTSIVGAAAGAYAGALAAQKIAERTKYREQLLKEIRDTNAATTLAFGICNSMLMIKAQHIKALKEKFDAAKAAILEHKRKMTAGEIPHGTEFRFDADLQTLALPPLPIPILQRQVFEKLSVRGRPLSLVTTLAQTTHSLGAVLEMRNSLIASYKVGNPPLTARLYFGLPQGDVINADYPSSIDAISRQTDDCIFFSHLLNKDLTEHGNALAAQFKKQFGKGAPPITESGFEKAEKEGLMPDANDYPDWFSAFKKKDVTP